MKRGGVTYGSGRGGRGRGRSRGSVETHRWVQTVVKCQKHPCLNSGSPWSKCTPGTCKFTNLPYDACVQQVRHLMSPDHAPECKDKSRCIYLHPRPSKDGNKWVRIEKIHEALMKELASAGQAFDTVKFLEGWSSPVHQVIYAVLNWPSTKSIYNKGKVILPKKMLALMALYFGADMRGVRQKDVEKLGMIEVGDAEMVLEHPSSKFGISSEADLKEVIKYCYAYEQMETERSRARMGIHQSYTSNYETGGMQEEEVKSALGKAITRAQSYAATHSLEEKLKKEVIGYVTSNMSAVEAGPAVFRFPSLSEISLAPAPESSPRETLEPQRMRCRIEARQMPLVDFLQDQHDLLRADCFLSLTRFIAKEFMHSQDVKDARGAWSFCGFRIDETVTSREETVFVASVEAGGVTEQRASEIFMSGNVALISDWKANICWFTVHSDPVYKGDVIDVPLKFHECSSSHYIKQLVSTRAFNLVVHGVFFTAYHSTLAALQRAVRTFSSGCRQWQTVLTTTPTTDSFASAHTLASTSVPALWSGLDQSQREALEAVKQGKRIVLIQGPPGTGKTYVGSRAALLHCQSRRDEMENLLYPLKLRKIAAESIKYKGESKAKLRDIEREMRLVGQNVKKGPILIVTFKNHSLDEFLCEIKSSEVWKSWKLPDSSLLRIGGRCEHAQLENHTLFNLRKTERPPYFPADPIQKLVARIRADGMPREDVYVEMGSQFPGWFTMSMEEFNSITDQRIKTLDARQISVHVSGGGRYRGDEGPDSGGDDDEGEEGDTNIDIMRRESKEVNRTRDKGKFDGYSTTHLPPPRLKYGHVLSTRDTVYASAHRSQWKEMLCYCVSYYIQSQTQTSKDQNHNDLRAEWDLGSNSAIAQNALIVAATVTGCCMRLQLIQDCRPSVLIVEEAAEILESQLLPLMLLPSIEQIILVGDDKQLQPQSQEYSLQRMGLDMSVFERLRLLKHSVHMLTVQRRMHPEFSALVRHLYDGKLVDADVVMNRVDKVWPLLPRCFMWSHGFPESNSRNGVSGITNEYEAGAVLMLVERLMNAGVSPGSLTVLTNYKRQKAVLRKELDQMYGKSAVGGPLKAPHVSTVDFFQGDENDYIILSLVRTLKPTAFLKNPRRMCVALSRARHGLLIIGSDQLLTEFVHWRMSLGAMVVKPSLELPLRCKRHPTSILPTFVGGEVPKCSHQCGGANALCTRKHACVKVCHEGKCGPCEVFVEAECPVEGCAGKVSGICSKLSEAQCKAIRKGKRPDCEHEWEAECYKMKTGKIPKCNVIVSKQKPCGHIVEAKCVEWKSAKCVAPCIVTLPCGHPCKKACYEPHICETRIMHTHPVCGHYVEGPCNPSWDKVVCPSTCPRILPCGHTCIKKCQEAHSEHVCLGDREETLSCGHKQQVACAGTYKNCQEKCMRTLPCGHTCPAKCRDPCPVGECKQEEVRKCKKCKGSIQVKCFEATMEHLCKNCKKQKQNAINAKIEHLQSMPENTKGVECEHKETLTESGLVAKLMKTQSDVQLEAYRRVRVPAADLLYYRKKLQIGRCHTSLWFLISTLNNAHVISKSCPQGTQARVLKVIVEGLVEAKGHYEVETCYSRVVYVVDVVPKGAALVDFDTFEKKVTQKFKELPASSKHKTPASMIVQLLQDYNFEHGRCDDLVKPAKDPLSDFEHSAVYLFTVETPKAYQKIKDTIKNKAEPISDTFVQYMYYFFTACQKLTIEVERTVLYRGMSVPRSTLDQYKEGNQLHWTAMSSWSKSPRVAGSFTLTANEEQVTFKVETCKLVSIAEYSHYKGEQEVLLPCSTTLFIQKREDGPSRLITVTEIKGEVKC